GRRASAHERAGERAEGLLDDGHASTSRVDCGTDADRRPTISTAAPVATTSRAIVPANANASRVPPCAVSEPARSPPSGAPPMKAKKYRLAARPRRCSGAASWSVASALDPHRT